MLHYDSNDTVLHASLYSWDLGSSLNKYADYYSAVLSLNLLGLLEITQLGNAMAKRSGGEKVSGPPGQVVPYATQLLQY